MSRVKAVSPGMQKPALGTLACTFTDADELPDDPLSLHELAVQWNFHKNVECRNCVERQC